MLQSERRNPFSPCSITPHHPTLLAARPPPLHFPIFHVLPLSLDFVSFSFCLLLPLLLLQLGYSKSALSSLIGVRGGATSEIKFGAIFLFISRMAVCRSHNLTSLRRCNNTGFYLEFSDRGGVMADQGVWGTEVPQRGPWAEPRWRSGVEAPRSCIGSV